MHTVNKAIETAGRLLVAQHHEARQDARTAYTEMKADERNVSLEQGQDTRFVVERLLEDATAAQTAHSTQVAELQDQLFTLTSYLCMGVFFMWWYTATSYRLVSVCEGGWLSGLSCWGTKFSVVVVQALWIMLVVLGKNIKAVMILFCIANG